MTSQTLDGGIETSGAARGALPAGLVGIGHVVLILFLASLLIPIRMDIAGIRFTPHRLFIVVTALPLIAKFFSPLAPRLRAGDILMLIFALWTGFVLIFHHGMERFPYAVMNAMEYAVPYFLARYLIRTKEDVKTFFRTFAASVLVLLPFAVFEGFTDRQLINEVLSKAFQVYGNVHQEMRLGLHRAQVVFGHPIHFGLYSVALFGMSLYVYATPMRGVLWTAVLGAGTIFSASSAPILAAMIQVFLVAWHKVLGPRWWLLTGLFSFVYVFLSFASNRGPVIIFIETFTLNPRTAWWRVHQWNFGMENVYANPIFGLGLNDWVRPHFLVGSIDNFWLLLAIRYGATGALLIIAALAVNLAMIIRTPSPDPETSRLRTGYMISFVGTLFTLCTVHIWDELAAATFFIFGVAMFFASDAVRTGGGSGRAAEAAGPARPGRGGMPLAYTRFGPAAGGRAAQSEARATDDPAPRRPAEEPGRAPRAPAYTRASSSRRAPS